MHTNIVMQIDLSHVYSNKKIQVVFKIHPKVLAQDFPSSVETFQSSPGHVLQNGLLVKRNDPFVLLKQITYQTQHHMKLNHHILLHSEI